MEAKTEVAKTETVVEIPYVKYAIAPDGRKNSNDYRYVTHDELDTWTFEDFVKNGMYESLKMQKFRRLYIDFDFKTEDKNIAENANKCYEWLCELEETFDLCAICGYCTDENIHKALGAALRRAIELKKDLKCDKTLSIHAVFYNTRMDANEMHSILYETQNTYGNVIEFVDRKVYKVYDEEEPKEQLFRHPYANKYMRENTYSKGENKGVNPANLKHPYKASQLVITPRGDERIVTKDEWIKMFPMIEHEDKPAKTTKESKVVFKNTDDDDELEDWVQMLIPEEIKNDISPEEVVKDLDKRYAQSKSHITKELFDTIVKGFDDLYISNDKEDVNKEITLFILFSALYACIGDEITEKDVLDAVTWIVINGDLTKEAKKHWKARLEQAQKNTECKGPGALFIYLRNFNKEYYKQHVRPLLMKYKKQAVLEAKFDLKDNFTIKDIRMKGFACEYQKDGDVEKLDYDAVLSDLHRVMLVVDQGSGLYVLKERDAKNDKMTVGYYNQKDAFNMLKQLKIGTELKQKQYRKGEEHQLVNKNAFDVYDATTNNAMFYKSSICFYSENPEDFSFFQGYKYEPVQNDALIKKFNDHVRDVICKSDEKLYTYVQSWFATIIQDPLARTCTALVIKGTEGTGKNTVTDAWCELLNGYSNANVSDIDSIIGKYNVAVENKKLLIINEMDSVEMSTKALYNRLKKLITDPTVDIHAKNVSVRPGVTNVANLVIVSNEFNPVMVSDKDRRYVIMTPSDKHVNDRAYFNDLYAQMKPSRTKPYIKEFMEALMYYYMNYKVEIDLADIPETRERKMAKEANKSAIEAFVEEYADELSGDGIAPKDCFDKFNRFIAENKFKTNYKSRTFKAEMSRFCAVDDDDQLHRYKGKRVYRFTDEMIKRYENIAKQLIEDKNAAVDTSAAKDESDEDE